MIEVGRLCVKLAGRDAGLKCVIVEVIDDNYVLIDGQTRRRKCNVNHLEPLKQLVKIKKGASRAEVKKAFKELNLEVRETKPKPAAERPKKKPRVKRTASSKQEASKPRTSAERGEDKAEKSEKEQPGKTAKKEASNAKPAKAEGDKQKEKSKQ